MHRNISNVDGFQTGKIQSRHSPLKSMAISCCVIMDLSAFYRASSPPPPAINLADFWPNNSDL